MLDTMDNPLISDPPHRILVADDDPVLRAVTVHALAQLGFQADVAEDGEAVLEALVQTEYSIIFMDCQMPRLDGFGAATRIRQQGKAIRQPVIIALTALLTGANRARCFEAGMDDYLGKPVGPGELTRCLERWTRQPAGDEWKKGDEYNGDRYDGGGRTGRHADELKLMHLFLNDAPRRLAAMRIALEARDAAALESAAHTLKGSSGVVGALDLARRCEVLEMLGESASFEQASSELLRCEAEFQLVHHQLAGKIAQLEAGPRASNDPVAERQ